MRAWAQQESAGLSGLRIYGSNAARPASVMVTDRGRATSSTIMKNPLRAAASDAA